MRRNKKSRNKKTTNPSIMSFFTKVNKNSEKNNSQPKKEINASTNKQVLQILVDTNIKTSPANDITNDIQLLTLNNDAQKNKDHSNAKTEQKVKSISRNHFEQACIEIWTPLFKAIKDNNDSFDNEDDKKSANIPAIEPKVAFNKNNKDVSYKLGIGKGRPGTGFQSQGDHVIAYALLNKPFEIFTKNYKNDEFIYELFTLLSLNLPNDISQQLMPIKELLISKYNAYKETPQEAQRNDYIVMLKKYIPPIVRNHIKSIAKRPGTTFRSSKEKISKPKKNEGSEIRDALAKIEKLEKQQCIAKNEEYLVDQMLKLIHYPIDFAPKNHDYKPKKIKDKKSRLFDRNNNSSILIEILKNFLRTFFFTFESFLNKKNFNKHKIVMIFLKKFLGKENKDPAAWKLTVNMVKNITLHVKSRVTDNLDEIIDYTRKLVRQNNTSTKSIPDLVRTVSGHKTPSPTNIDGKWHDLQPTLQEIDRYIAERIEKYHLSQMEVNYIKANDTSKAVNDKTPKSEQKNSTKVQTPVKNIDSSQPSTHTQHAKRRKSIDNASSSDTPRTQNDSHIRRGSTGSNSHARRGSTGSNSHARRGSTGSTRATQSTLNQFFVPAPQQQHKNSRNNSHTPCASTGSTLIKQTTRGSCFKSKQ